MKRYSYKKVVLVALGVFVYAFVAYNNKMVACATSTQEQLNKVTSEKNDIQSNLNEVNENINGLKSTRKTLDKELTNLNHQLELVSARLEELYLQISEKEAEIEETGKALEDAIATEEWQYKCMIIRVRFMFEKNDKSVINAILEAGSLSEMLNVADYYEKIAKYDNNKLSEFKEIHRLVQEKKELLEQEKAELDAIQVLAEEEKSKVSVLITQTAEKISEYSEDIEEAEAEALKIEAELKEKEAEEKALKKKLAEEQAMSRLAANSAWRDISQVTFDDGDRYLLANLIYCEAGGEPYEGKVAVGAVVINRLLSSVFPDTVSGVIYQKKQFSPVASGRLAIALSVNKATESCYRAADEAMSGVTNVGNCLFFRTPIPGLEGLNIGGHVFY